MTGNPFPSLEMTERATGLRARERLSTNENEFGPAPSVLSAIAAAAGTVHRYPDCDHFVLRHRLADRLGVPPDHVHIGPGIDGLLAAVCRGHLRPGRTAITSAATYPTFAYFAESAGANLYRAAYRGVAVDVAGIAEHARRTAAAVVYVADPDNPTGNCLGRRTLLDFADAMPPETLLVVDGAYAEYQAAPRRLRADDVIDRHMLWLRTFSKAYALAGLRVGYAIGHPDLLEVLRRGAEHYVVGRLSETAALAALDDDDYLATTVDRTAEGRADYTERLTELGFEVLTGSANFLTFRCPDRVDAATLADSLRATGVFVRHLTIAPLQDCIRITIGPAPQRHTVLTQIAELSTGSIALRP
ncbi:pyridoxal phosphate-dependent aminotransferase [Nocardia sp. NPDC052566]|uniref:pyridoxal phosphate-dependent aminotransferase n=1 Tax=Nocardia sp. NPDC052566 TaxID=3364330 RepID=UPI0037C87615